MNKLQDVDLFDVMKVEAFSDCQYGWKISIPLYVLLQYENIVLDQNIFDIIQNGCGVNLSQKDFREDWACITFMQENKNSGFAYENAFYKLPETLTVKSVEHGPEVVKGIARVKNIYGLRYYFLPRQQLIDSLWQKKLDFENKEQKNVNFSGCENYIEPSDLEKILITQTECICFEIKKNPNEKCDAKERYYLAAVDHAKKSYIETGVDLSFERDESEVWIEPTKYHGTKTDFNSSKYQLSQMYKKNKPELTTQNIDNKKGISKNPFIEVIDPNLRHVEMEFSFDYTAIFDALKNIYYEALFPKELRKLLQEQKNNKPQTFYLRYEICCKSGDWINYRNEDFSYQNKNNLKNGVGTVHLFSVSGDKVIDYGSAKSQVCFKKIYEMKLYVGTKRGVELFLPDECMCLTCVSVSKEKITFGLVNSSQQIQTVFNDFAKDININAYYNVNKHPDNLMNNLTTYMLIHNGNKRFFEQFKSLPTPTKKEIDKHYQNFIDERNPNHEFEQNKNVINAIKTETNQNISGTNSEISSSSNGFLTCVKNFFGCNNGKIIISVATGLGIGFTFGWIFSPISIGVLIILAVVDSQFTLPKTIQVFNFFTSCLSCKQSSAETDLQPNLEKQNQQNEQIE